MGIPQAQPGSYPPHAAGMDYDSLPPAPSATLSVDQHHAANRPAGGDQRVQQERAAREAKQALEAHGSFSGVRAAPTAAQP